MKRLLLFLALICLPQLLFAQNTGELMPLAFPSLDNALGTAKAVSGFICTYAAGTTTPASTYSDSALMTSWNSHGINASTRC